jgi:hypothetical protein
VKPKDDHWTAPDAYGQRVVDAESGGQLQFAATDPTTAVSISMPLPTESLLDE